MDRLKKYLLPFLMLTFLASLAIGFRSFLMANVIEPIALLCWAAWRAVSSVNQNIYWVILIVICSILVIRLLPSGRDHTPSSVYDYTYKSPSRVEYWKTLISDAVHGKEETESLRDGLKKLLTSAISQVERSNRIDWADSVAAGKAPLSPKARRYLFPSRKQSGSVPTSWLAGFVLPALGWLRRWAGKFSRQDTTPIDEILKYMETEMEISHERQFLDDYDDRTIDELFRKSH